MTFTQSVSTCFKKYATFSGRASRSEFWNFYLLVVVGYAIAIAADAVLFDAVLFSTPMIFGPITILFLLGIILPYFGVAWRRIHDLNLSGWWLVGYLLSYPVLGYLAYILADRAPSEMWQGFFVGVAIGLIASEAIVLLILYVRRGTNGQNRFGNDSLA